MYIVPINKGGSFRMKFIGFSTAFCEVSEVILMVDLQFLSSQNIVLGCACCFIRLSSRPPQHLTMAILAPGLFYIYIITTIYLFISQLRKTTTTTAPLIRPHRDSGGIVYLFNFSCQLQDPGSLFSFLVSLKCNIVLCSSTKSGG